MEAVKEALVATDKRINEIGRMVGYENTNHLIRLFKKYTGVTPSNYRKNSPVFTYIH
jgi:YesN/AraC family two-component response regulator